MSAKSVIAPTYAYTETEDPILYATYQEMMIVEYGIVSPPRASKLNYYDSVTLDLEVGGVEKLGKWDYAKEYWSCQCVAYVREYFELPQVGMAKNIWFKSEELGLTRTDSPKEGDLVVFNIGLYGHVSVIERVSDDKIQVREQNYLPCMITRRVLAIDDVTILGFVTK